MIKKFIPKKIKLKAKIALRNGKDRLKGNSAIFAEKGVPIVNKYELKVEQPIYFNPLAQNKIDNIKIAAKSIESIVILPNKLFSFWKLVGTPSEEKGFKTGRNIIGNDLQEDIGGGLCQISGIIYHLALLSGLKIVERYCHTIDLYTEDKRYTPIGTDATVVYGYKDVRFLNNSNQSFQYSFEISNNTFIGTLHSDQPITMRPLKFERKEFKNYRTVDTYRTQENGDMEHINQSKYLLPK